MAQSVRKLFARRLRTLREKKGFTQQQLAEKAGIDYKHYQSLEGKNPPNVGIDTVKRLADTLGVNLHQLFRF